MADSNITKRALAAALQELMEKTPFEKIQIAQICDRCQMNRKSFYYHFEDKYDLVNWIFDAKFRALADEFLTDDSSEDHWELIGRACACLYEERAFYRKALAIRGQNSLSDHLREVLSPLIRKRIEQDTGEAEPDGFVTEFFVDAVLCAIGRWLQDPNCPPPEEFVAKVRHILQVGALAVFRRMDPAEEWV